MRSLLVRTGAKVDRHARGEPGVGCGVVLRSTRQGARERHQPIERAAVEQMPADVAGDGAADGALA